MFIRYHSLLIMCFLLLFAGCQSQPQRKSLGADAQASALFDEIFDEWVVRSPTFQAWLGIKTDYGNWDDLSEEHAAQSLVLHNQQLERLRDIDLKDLSDDVALSYRLLEVKWTP